MSLPCRVDRVPGPPADCKGKRRSGGHDMRRPALVLDFGNVVAHFDYAKACAGFGRALGISGEEFLARLRRQGFSPLIQRYEAGAMTNAEFSRGVCDLVGLEIPHGEF